MDNEWVVLRIYINITNILETKYSHGTVRMLSFGGKCDCDNFKGDVLPGAVDTQRLQNDGTGTLSARYMLEGVDKEGQKCHIFIENNATIGTGEAMITKPSIYTDSSNLKWLEKAELFGEIVTEDEQLVILIKNWRR